MDGLKRATFTPVPRIIAWMARGVDANRASSAAADGLPPRVALEDLLPVVRHPEPPQQGRDGAAVRGRRRAQQPRLVAQLGR